MSEYLSVNGQVKFLMRHGMEFHDVSIHEAKELLSNYTYFHKIISYKHFFEQYNTDEYGEDLFNGLDFGDLYELQQIDRRLRKKFNDVCLEVEYYFKVFLLKIIEDETLPIDHYFYYDVVDVEKRYHVNAKMEKRAKDFDDVYSKKMLEKFPGKKPVWVLNEYLSFGEVLELFTNYVHKKKITKYDFELEFLLRVKKLLN